MNKRFIGLVLMFILTSIVIPIEANLDTEEVKMEMVPNSVPNDDLEDLILEAVSDNLTEIESWDYNYGNQYDVIVQGNYAFVSCYEDGILAYDVSDPTNPFIVGHYLLPGNRFVDGIDILNDILYMACYTYGVISLNVSDPTNMVYMDRFDTSGSAYEVLVDGNFVFVAGLTGGMQILNVTNPSDISQVGSYYNGSAYCYEIDKEGSYIYSATRNYGLDIIDISDETNPVKVANYFGTEYVNDVEVKGNYAYCASAVSGLEVLDITDKANPTFVTSQYTSGNYFNLLIDGNTIYIGRYYSGVISVNITTPSSPTYITFLTQTQNRFLQGMCVNESTLYLAFDKEGFDIYDITQTTAPSLQSSIPNNGDFYDIAIKDNYAFIAGYNYGFFVFDISDPYSVVMEYKEQLTDTQVRRMAIDGDLLYIANGDLRIYNISNPTSPTFVDEYTNYGIHDVVIRGNYAYCAAYDDGLVILDITDVHTIAYVNSITDGNYTRGIDVVGNYAYLAAHGGGLQIVDITNPASLSYIYRNQPGGYAYGVWASDGLVLLANGWGGLYAFNTTNLLSVIIIDSIDPGGYSYDVKVEGRYMYLADGWSGLHVYEWSPTSELLDVGEFYDDDGKVFGVTVINGTIYCADSQGGLEILLHDNDGDTLSNHVEQLYYGTDIDDVDTDGDTINDNVEVFTYGTDPANADTDGDGFNDYEEITAGIDGFITDPLRSDTDYDLLNDYEEYNSYGTNPLLYDTDGDGLDDGTEVLVYYTDPLDTDTDGDTIDDQEEVLPGNDGYVTDPLDADTDGDGIEDYEEIILGTDGFVTDPTDEDTDNDGHTDGDEITAGTDPTDPNDPAPETSPSPSPTPTETSGFQHGLIFGFSLITLVAVIVWITDRRRIKYTG